MKKIFLLFIIFVFSFSNTFSYIEDDQNIVSKYSSLLDKNPTGKKYKYSIDKILESLNGKTSKKKSINEKLSKIDLQEINSINKNAYYALMYFQLKLNIYLNYYEENNGESIDKKGDSVNHKGTYEDLVIEVITDKRNTESGISLVLSNLNKLQSFSQAQIIRKDFSDEGVSEFMQENDIKTLPALVFSTKNFDVSNDELQQGQQKKINEYLLPLPDGEYYLEIGSTYDPFIKISDRGFKVLEEGLLEEIKSNSYTRGNSDAKITWLEFSDFGCRYCKKMHTTDKVPAKVMEAYPEDVNMIFMNMPFRDRESSESLECIGELAGTDTYYQAIDQGFANSESGVDAIYNTVADSVNKEDFDACYSEKRGSTRIDYHMAVGQENFNVQGTPNNVLINNQTGEYEVIPGAYPYDSFTDLIDNLLLD